LITYSCEDLTESIGPDRLKSQFPMSFHHEQ